MNIRKHSSDTNEESVWDYPRPPRCEPFRGSIRVVLGGTEIARTEECLRVLETSHPPVYYIAPQYIQMSLLQKSSRQTWCEWKGTATYYSFPGNDDAIPDIAWCYESPTPAFEAIHNHLAFYPSKVDACYVNEERVQSQPGDFYGGWITSQIKGPFKGSPGTAGW